MYFLQGGFWTESRAGAIFFALLAALLLVLAALSALESKLLSRQLTPITLRVREGIGRFPWIAGLIMFGLGFLAGHFFAGN